MPAAASVNGHHHISSPPVKPSVRLLTLLADPVTSTRSGTIRLASVFHPSLKVVAKSSKTRQASRTIWDRKSVTCMYKGTVKGKSSGEGGGGKGGRTYVRVYEEKRQWCKRDAKGKEDTRRGSMLGQTRENAIVAATMVETAQGGGLQA